MEFRCSSHFVPDNPLLSQITSDSCLTLCEMFACKAWYLYYILIFNTDMTII